MASSRMTGPVLQWTADSELFKEAGAFLSDLFPTCRSEGGFWASRERMELVLEMGSVISRYT